VEKLQLERVELREIELPLKAPFETSFGRITRRRILLVKVLDKAGMSGYGECVAGENPFYNHETIDTAWLMTTKYIVPRLDAVRIEQAAQVRDALAPIRENRMAKGGVEAAIWDLEAKLAEQPLWRYIGGTRTEIACGVSIGLKDSTEALLESVGREIDSGYQRIKIKIKPGRDAQLVEAIRRVFPDITLSVDANSAYSVETDTPLFQRLGEYNLLMIETMPSCSVRSLPTSVSTSPSSVWRTHSTRSSWARAASSTSSSVASAATARRKTSSRPRGRTASPSGAAECSKRASAARTTSPCPRCPVSRCPATSPPPHVTGAKTSSIRR
jgi:hypothetical protein